LILKNSKNSNKFGHFSVKLVPDAEHRSASDAGTSRTKTKQSKIVKGIASNASTRAKGVNKPAAIPSSTGSSLPVEYSDDVTGNYEPL
jgi:hypothetical protein